MTYPHGTRRRLAGAAALAALVAGCFGLAEPAVAYSTALARAPYLTDETDSSVTVNFGTTTTIKKVRARYGLSSGGTCDPSTLTSAATTKTGYTVTYPTPSGTANASQFPSR